jgi:dolichol-phosphate mannosyltransferase
MPVYNEQQVIKKVLDDWINVIPNNTSNLLVINDGSSDKTLEILTEYQTRFSNLEVLNKKNAGHGMAILDGYSYAIENNYDYVFQIDSDNQFKIRDFHKIWELRNNEKYDLIMGNRKNRNDPIIRVILSKIFLRAFIFFIYQKYILDPNIPYRLVKINILKKFIEFKNDKILAPNIQLSIFAKKIKFIDVDHLPRENQKNYNWSLLKIFRFGLSLILELLNFRFKKIFF